LLPMRKGSFGKRHVWTVYTKYDGIRILPVVDTSLSVHEG
jgi:hypothetical protein